MIFVKPQVKSQLVKFSFEEAFIVFRNKWFPRLSPRSSKRNRSRLIFILYMYYKFNRIIACNAGNRFQVDDVLI